MFIELETRIGRSHTLRRAAESLPFPVLMYATTSDFDEERREDECAPEMSETTTEVVEELSTAAVSFPTTIWPRWTVSNLPGLLPFLPKVPGHKESVGVLQQLSPRVIKSECILTRRFWTLSSSNHGTTQPKDTASTNPSRVQTIRNGTTTVPTSTVTQQMPKLMKKQDVLSALSTIASALLKLSIFKGFPSILPKSLRPSKTWLRREFLTNIAVYSGIIVLVIEGSGCLLGLMAGAMPPGLVFMISALLMMMVIAIMTIGHDPNSETHGLLSPSLSVSSISQKNLRLR